MVAKTKKPAPVKKPPPKKAPKVEAPEVKVAAGESIVRGLNARQPDGRVQSYATETTAITPITYGSWQDAYSFFRDKLFDKLPGDKLPDVLIVYSRRARSGGHYAYELYSSRNGKALCSEVSLNPDGFIGRSDEWILSVLVHEMAHVWQFAFGKASGSYHNKQWADVMESIGLIASNSGAIGGRRTGQQMSHYVLKDGPFARAYAELAATGWRLDLESAPMRGPDRKKSESKTPFTCGQCLQNLWGKPSLDAYCGPCSRAILEALGVDTDAMAPAKALTRDQLAKAPTAPVDARIDDEPPSLSAH